MATRAAIAAQDRKSREDIANKDREVKKYEAKSGRVKAVSGAVKDMSDATNKAAGIVKMFNHPEWYKKFGSSDYTADLPNFARSGLETIKGFLAHYGSTGAANEAEYSQFTQPGICAIQFVSSVPNQTISSTGYRHSPLNVGLSRFMSELRKMNSRIGDYDASDFGLYWYAVADLLFVIERVRLGIQVYNTYYIDNAYFARHLLTALGFNANSFFSNIAQYKYLCDKFINMFNSNIVAPSNVTFLLRRLWMARVIAKDHMGPNAQLYVFVPRRVGTLAFNEDKVTFEDSLFNSASYSAVESILNTMMSRLTDSVGMQTMMADLRAGIPESNFLKLEELDAHAEVYITDSKEDLEQIHNLQSLPVHITDGDTKLYASTPHTPSLAINAMADGYVAQGIPNSGLTALDLVGPAVYNSGSDPLITFQTTNGVRNAEFLNFYDENSKADDVLEATRLRTVWETNVYSGVNYAIPNFCGTEIVTHYVFYTLSQGGSLIETIFGTDVIYHRSQPCLKIVTESVLIASRFDWIPRTRLWSVDWDANGLTGVYDYQTFGEIDNVVPLSNANLMNLHEQCTLSLFYVDSSEFAKARV